MKYLNILAFITVLTVNALANILPINDLNTGEVSALYPNLFTPAGLTFSIWSVIYLFLAGYCVYPFISKQDRRARDIAPLFWITCILNCTWIFIWHNLFVELSLVIMALLLVVLCIIYIRLHRHTPVSKLEKWLVYKPFSLYLAWICVAIIANTAAVLVSHGFDPPSAANWVIGMIIATQIIVYLISKQYRDIAFSLVIIWALTGIIIKRVDAEPLFQPIVIACILAIIFDAWVALHFRYRKSLT